MPRLPEPPIPVDVLLLAYRSGIFPMADDRDDPEVFWVEPRDRAIIPLDDFRCSKSLKKTLRRDRFTISCDRAFEQVMEECAQPRSSAKGEESGSWISHRIADSYAALHAAGHAHSIECWEDGALVGGLYGVTFDRVFCGESMFSRVADSSKVALAALIASMKHGGFRLLDCQFMTDHLASLGAVEIPQAQYLQLLESARGEPRCSLPAAYASLLAESSDGAESSSPGKLIAQSFTQTS